MVTDKPDNIVKRKSHVWPDWYSAIAAYQKPDTLKSTWQLLNTIVPYFGLWYLMIQSIQLNYPYPVTLILNLPTAAFLVRIFILFHDCVHGSCFNSKRINTFFGYFLGVLLFTSFEEWRFIHLHHHQLPTILRWFSGNIGYHHIHHLNAKIPNYHLKKCYDAIPELQTNTALAIGKKPFLLSVKIVG